MGDKQKEYPVEFKREAVRLIETSGKTAVQIARELGVSDSVLYHWRKILAEKESKLFLVKVIKLRLKKNSVGCDRRMNDCGWKGIS